MTSAFLSYSRKDEGLAYYITKALRARGVDVFIDEQGLRSGPFWGQLAREIRRREFFIVLLSPEAVESKWVPKEIAWALGTQSKESNIIPILVKHLSLDDWEKIFVLYAFQQIDFTDWFTHHQVEEPLNKLAEYMNLPSELVSEIPVSKPFAEMEEWEGAEEEEEEPWLSLSDIRELLDTAESVKNDNRTRAIFLYHQALDGLQDYIKRYEEYRG